MGMIGFFTDKLRIGGPGAGKICPGQVLPAPSLDASH